MIEVFIAHLHELPQAQKLTLAGADSHTEPTPVALVRSAFELPAAGRASIEAAAHECLGATVTTRFETSPEFVCGVELTIGGIKIAWSVADYLFSLSQSVAALVEPEPAAPKLVTQHGH